MSQVVNCLVPNTRRHNHEIRENLACTNNVQRKIAKKSILAKCDIQCIVLHRKKYC